MVMFYNKKQIDRGDGVRHNFVKTLMTPTFVVGVILFVIMTSVRLIYSE